MKSNHFVRKALLAFLAMVASVVASAGFVSAEEIPEYRLQVTPSFEEIDKSLKPGGTYTGKFKIQNTGSKEFRYEIDFSPYSIVDEKYNIDSETESDYTQLSKWITVDKNSGSIEADGSVDVEYTISVPRDVAAGGQYALINVKMLTDDGDQVEGSAFKVTKQVGFRVLASINGTTRKTGSISDNKVPGFIFNPPITATSVVSNTGNIHAKAKYILQVFPLFGDEEVYTNEENPVELTILPETRRYNELSWDGAPHLGIFRVRQTVKIFDEVSVTEKLVFLCPIWFLFIVLLLIFCVIFWVVSRVRSRRKEA